jgi:streptogrisin D
MVPLKIRSFVVSACGVLALAAAAPAAVAAPPVDAVGSAARAASVAQVADALGAEHGGFFLDQQGNPTVNVLTQADAMRARGFGVQSRVVKYSERQLTAVQDSLNSFAGLKNTAWGLDPSTNQVVITISDAADPAGAAKLEAAAAKFGDQVRVKHSHRKMEAYVRGGDGITNNQLRCSVGFNVKTGGRLLVLTAGHCTNLGGTWTGLGNVVASDCPGADSGLIENNSGNGPSRVNTGQAITSVGRATVGQRITKSGSTTGVTSGKVTAVELTVNFDVGVMRHMIETSVPSDRGDSGGSGYDGSAGLGTLSGGDTSITYFYPLNLEFSAYGLRLP